MVERRMNVEIYGLGIVAACFVVGQILGRILGMLIGTGGDVGGVGFAMLFLVLFTYWLEKNDKKLAASTEKGIAFLAGIYIPIIVAMSAIQNVYGALAGGAVAALAGVLSVLVCLALVPVVSRIGGKKNTSA